MSLIPNELKYLDSHEWLRLESDGLVTIGITEHAIENLGDIVFVELPKVGDVFSAGDASAVVESVKAASDIYSPIEGEVVAVNATLVDSPEMLQDDAYDNGWFFKLKISDPTVLETLMNANDYAALIGE